MKFTISGKFVASLSPILRAMPKSFDNTSDVAWFTIEKDGVYLRCFSPQNSALVVVLLQAKNWEEHIPFAFGMQCARFLGAIEAFSGVGDVDVIVSENSVLFQSGRLKLKLPLVSSTADFEEIAYCFLPETISGRDVYFTPVLIEAIRRLPGSIIDDNEASKFSSIALLPYEDDTLLVTGVTPTASMMIFLSLPRPEGFDEPMWLSKLTFTFAALLEKDSDVSITHTGKRVIISSASGITVAHAAPARGLTPDSFRSVFSMIAAPTVRCTVPARDFASAVNVISKVLITPKSEVRSVLVELENQSLRLFAEDATGSSVDQEVSASHADGESFHFSADLRLLASLGRLRGDSLGIDYTAPSKPVLMTSYEGIGVKYKDFGSDIFVMLMPLREKEG